MVGTRPPKGSVERQHITTLRALLEQLSQKREIEVHVAQFVFGGNYIYFDDESRASRMIHVDAERIMDWRSALADLRTTPDPKRANPCGPRRRVVLGDL